ncbi:ABC transporter ATP-binding protein [Marivirga salinae]|uniref:ABC transporter ATP-binding protein n=1 Tax=Marivirga salinarum TaxID=3059078 RepID=A0AA49J930_9BACT|nr:ABC transporter ATP-binding protein [Marivirga sp. BDSF4-3]WKK73994.2 ABC transporter ATP-binding protein [Marivirga sp. BDSF4-3]
MEKVLLEVKSIFLTINKANILKDISFSISKNAILGIIGSNGSGKTSLIKVISRNYFPDCGQIHFNQKNAILYNNREFSKVAGFLVGEANVYKHLSIEDNLKYISILYGLPAYKINKILDIVNLKKVKNKLVKSISLGMRQRLGIGFAFIHEPDLIVLDEPTNGLDQSGVEDLISLILFLNSQYNVTFMVAGHDFDFLDRICNSLIHLKNGSINYNNTDLENNTKTVHEIYNECNY